MLRKNVKLEQEYALLNGMNGIIDTKNSTIDTNKGTIADTIDTNKKTITDIDYN